MANSSSKIFKNFELENFRLSITFKSTNCCRAKANCSLPKRQIWNRDGSSPLERRTVVLLPTDVELVKRSNKTAYRSDTTGPIGGDKIFISQLFTLQIRCKYLTQMGFILVKRGSHQMPSWPNPYGIFAVFYRFAAWIWFWTAIFYKVEYVP